MELLIGSSYQNFNIIKIYGSAFLGCKDKSSPPTSNDNPAPVQNRSAKRGIAYNLTADADLAALSKSVNWWYNWGLSTGAPVNYNKTYGMEFIPMLWGGNTSASDLNNIKNFILAHHEIKYLLVMNEPNLTDQANRTPAQASFNWLKYEQVVNDLAAQGDTVSLLGTCNELGNYVWL